jgi:general secretion pathway protein G
MSIQKGFTLVELLLMAGVILLISTLAVIAVNAARSKERDAVRLGNIRQIQTSLENYFTDRNAYPDGTSLPLGDSVQSACLGAEGFAESCTGSSTIFLRAVPGTYAKGLKGLSVCGEPSRHAFCYTVKDDGMNYAIQFELENAVSMVGLVDGANCATPNGIEGGACE